MPSTIYTYACYFLFPLYAWQKLGHLSQSLGRSLNVLTHVQQSQVLYENICHLLHRVDGFSHSCRSLSAANQFSWASTLNRLNTQSYKSCPVGLRRFLRQQDLLTLFLDHQLIPSRYSFGWIMNGQWWPSIFNRKRGGCSQ